MFDEKSRQELKFYVYMLIDPSDNKPFYIGKGMDNRVFQHLACSLTDLDISTAKYDKIREIVQADRMVKHIIIRHGLTEREAYQIEASLIDTLTYCGILLSNKVAGHNSIERGLMTSDEVIRLYNAQPLDKIGTDCILININKKYERGKGGQSIYQATKETWMISKKRLNQLKYVLSEYRGLIVEVFEVEQWYEKERGYLPGAKRYGQTKIGYGFNGVRAPDEIRNQYINKSIAHAKKRGSAAAIRYNL